MVNAGHGIIIAVLMTLGMLNPQTMVSTDINTAAGNGQWSTLHTAAYLPDGAGAILNLNFKSLTQDQLQALWLSKLTEIETINTAILQNLKQGDRRDTREAKIALALARQVIELKPLEASAGLYIDGANRSVRLLAALQVEKMEILTFLLDTFGIIMEGENETITSRQGPWTRISTRKPIDKSNQITFTYKEDVLLFEWAIGGDLQMIDMVMQGGFTPVSADTSAYQKAVTARGDSSDIIFFSTDMQKTFAQLNAAPSPSLKAFNRIFQPQAAGMVAYTLKMNQKVFKENFSLIGGTGQGLFSAITNQSKKIDSRLLSLIPADAVVVQASGFDYSKMLDILLASLESHPDTQDAAAAINTGLDGLADGGMDVRNAIINNIEGSAAFFVSLPEGGLPVPGIGLLVRIKDDGTGIMEILEMLQNDNFKLNSRQINGLQAYTAQPRRMPTAITFGIIPQPRTFVIASSPEAFSKITNAAAKPGIAKFAPDSNKMAEDMLLYQYINISALGQMGYGLLQAQLPKMANRNPLLKGIDPMQLPAPDQLFADAPPIITVTTRKSGTVTTSPIPGIRLISLFPAAMPIMGHGFMRGINQPAIKFFEEEQEMEELKREMEEEEVDIF